MATWRDGWFTLSPNLEPQLRRLQIGDDVIRTLNERRLHGARDVVEMGERPVVGRVTKAGFHDELGSQPYVVVQDISGREHYARLRLGTQPPQLGADVALSLQKAGAVSWRSNSLSRSNSPN